MANKLLILFSAGQLLTKSKLITLTGIILTLIAPIANQPLTLDQVFNPRVFIPCLEEVCYHEADIGCFPPWDLSRYFSLPFYSVCPEPPDNMGIQFYLLSRSSPTRLTQDLSRIKCGEKVAFVIHGYLSQSTDQLYLLPAVVLLRTFDHVILVDWRYPADPVVAFGFPIPAANFFVMHADVQVVGRVTANLIAKKLVVDKGSPCINPDDIRIVGFSAGGNMLYFISTWLKEKYDITLGHLVGLDPSGPPFYFSSNFAEKQLKPGLAKAVDMIQCTFNFEIPIITELQALTLRFGSFNATGDTKYLVNLPYSYIEQPGCFGTPSCSHFYCLVLYTASLFPNCGFRYSPCNSLGTTTYLDAKTNLNSRVEGPKGLICIQAGENPLRDCTSSNQARNG